MTGTWTPPPGGQPVPPPSYGQQPPFVPPPARGGMGKWAAFAGVLVAAIAGTAGITYALVRPSDNRPAAEPSATQANSADQDAAKKHLCEVFDVSTQDPVDRPPIANADGMNVPLVVRRLNSAVAVQSALTPAIPEDIAAKARTFIEKTLAMTSAAGSAVLKSPEVNERIADYNRAYLALSASCGIPR